MSSQILSQDKIDKILKRIAFQVVENNFQESAICLVGITGQGYQMALRLKELIAAIKPEVSLSTYELFVSKENPVRKDIHLNVPLDQLQDQVVVVVDDVMNTGRTQAYALGYLLQLSLKKVETAVLVNRQHTRFPIAATYSGISLSTTLDDHIEVRLENEVGAYLY